MVPDDFPSVLAGNPAMRLLKERVEVACFQDLPGTRERLLERIAGADAVINIRASTRFTSDVFTASPSLRLVSIWGTGTDHVDLVAARQHGVTVTNTPGVAAGAIAEHTLALLLAVARRLLRIDASVRRGEWMRGDVILLRGRTLGVIGMGAVGREFARLGVCLGMRVLGWTLHARKVPDVDMVRLDKLLGESDVVSVHLRLSDRTRGLLGAREIGLMKQGAILLNTARGPIVDEAAMVTALRDGRLGGAGLDVFDVEPLPAKHALTQLDNVVLTPHSAGIAPEVVDAGLRMAVENVLWFFAGRPRNVVHPVS